MEQLVYLVGILVDVPAAAQVAPDGRWSDFVFVAVDLAVDQVQQHVEADDLRGRDGVALAAFDRRLRRTEIRQSLAGERRARHRRAQRERRSPQDAAVADGVSIRAHAGRHHRRPVAG
jgi:hypothetical protein